VEGGDSNAPLVRIFNEHEKIRIVVAGPQRPPKKAEHHVVPDQEVVWLHPNEELSLRDLGNKNAKRRGQRAFSFIANINHN
jgi:hypothetical protein